MKPLEKRHLLGREGYYYPEQAMDALGGCAFRVDHLFLDIGACTPTCELNDEEKKYLAENS